MSYVPPPTGGRKIRFGDFPSSSSSESGSPVETRPPTVLQHDVTPLGGTKTTVAGRVAAPRRQPLQVAAGSSAVAPEAALLVSRESYMEICDRYEEMIRFHPEAHPGQDLREMSVNQGLVIMRQGVLNIKSKIDRLEIAAEQKALLRELVDNMNAQLQVGQLALQTRSARSAVGRQYREAEMEKAQQRRAALETEASSLERNVAVQGSALETLEQTAEERGNELRSLDRQLARQRDRLGELEMSLEGSSLNKERDASYVERLRSRNEMLAATIENLERELQGDHSAAAIKRIEEIEKRYGAELERMDAEIRGAQPVFEENRKLEAETRKLRDELQARRAENRQRDAQVIPQLEMQARARNEVQQAEETLRGQEEEYRKWFDSYSAIYALEQENNARADEIKRLEDELAQVKSKR